MTKVRLKVVNLPKLYNYLLMEKSNLLHNCCWTYNFWRYMCWTLDSMSRFLLRQTNKEPISWAWWFTPWSQLFKSRGGRITCLRPAWATKQDLPENKILKRIGGVVQWQNVYIACLKSCIHSPAPNTMWNRNTKNGYLKLFWEEEGFSCDVSQ
jgi:hypothetical protein